MHIQTTSDSRRLLVLLSAAVLALSACTASVGTNLELSSDGPGKRTITLDMGTQNMESYLDAGLGDIDESIQNHLPEQLKYAGITDDEDTFRATATFTLEFDSLEDYKEKVSALLTTSGSDIEPEIALVVEDTEFVSGFSLTENFTSADLMEWVRTGLIADGVVSESEASNVYITSSGNTVVFDEAEYDSYYSTLQVNQMSDNGFDAIDIQTTALADGTFEQLIQYTLSASKASALGDSLEAFFAQASIKDNGIQPTQNGSYYSSRWSQQFPAESVQQLTELTNKALAAEGVSYEWTQQPSPVDPTSVQSTLSGTVNCDSICSTSGQKIKQSLVYPSAWTFTDGNAYQAGYPGQDPDAALLQIEGAGQDFSVQFEQALPFRDVEISTVLGFGGDIVQTFNFTVAEEHLVLAGDGFAQLLRPVEGVGTLNEIDAEGGKTYQVVLEAASVDELNSKLDQFIPGATLTKSDAEGFSLKPAYELTLEIPMDQAFGGKQTTNEVGSTLTLPAMHGYADQQPALTVVPRIDDKKATVTTASGERVVLMAAASGPTVSGLVTLSILIVILVAIVFLAIVFRKRLKAAGQTAWSHRDQAVAAGHRVASGFGTATREATMNTSTLSASGGPTLGEMSPEQLAAHHTTHFRESDLR